MAKYVCPFSGATLQFKRSVDGERHYVESPYGWRSLFFPSLADARNWAKKINPAKPVIRTAQVGSLEDNRVFKVSGRGWLSYKTFHNEDEAVYWAKHRDGKPMKTAVLPSSHRINSVKEVEPPPDDVGLEDFTVTVDDIMETDERLREQESTKA